MDAALRIDTGKNCKNWLAQLPLTNAQQAHGLLLAQMKLLNAAMIAPAKLIALLDQGVNFEHATFAPVAKG